MRRAFAVCKVLLLAACSGPENITPMQIAIIPMPQSVQQERNVFPIRRELVLTAPDDELIRENVHYFAERVGDSTGLRLRVAALGTDDADIILELVERDLLRGLLVNSGSSMPDSTDEGYVLNVDESGIRIHAATQTGLYYGMVTLWQLLASMDKVSGMLGAVSIPDAPQFAWRGLMLDSARHMQSVNFIKRYIDWMSLHKLNVLHWHLTDDQAWRIEILKFPKLTAVGAWRVPAGAASANDIDPQTGQPRLYGGYYTQEDVREIVEHARLRHVTVVPEIDVPGHVTAAIAAYPELGVGGHEVNKVPASWGVYDNVLNLESATFDFLEDVFREVATLFPSPYVHVGGDEVVTRQWDESPRIRERMQELGIGTTQELQNYFVERLHRVLSGLGKTVLGWDEIVESDLPEDAIVMSWRGIDGAIAAADRGLRTVLSPAPVFYLDHLRSDAADAPPGRGGVITEQDIYSFDPLPDPLSDRQHFVLGLQANVWTEHIRTEERVAYMTWPRAAAVAELAWSRHEVRDWQDFSERLSLHLPRLRQLGIAVTDEDLASSGAMVAAMPGVVHLEDRELDLCSNAIVLALEDDAPLDGERNSYLLDIMDPCWIARDVELRVGLMVRASVGQLPFNFEIGDAIQQVVLSPPATPWGELNVRLGACDGPLLAALSLEPAHASEAATALPPVELNYPDGEVPATSTLCFRFSRAHIEPMWALDWIEFGSGFGESAQ